RPRLPRHARARCARRPGPGRPARAAPPALSGNCYAGPVPQSLYVELIPDPSGILVARIKCEMVGSREAPILENEIKAQLPARAWRVIVDLCEVTILASMGLGMLVTLNRECKDKGGKLVVCCVSPEIMSVLKTTRLERVLQILPDLDAAKKAMC